MKYKCLKIRNQPQLALGQKHEKISLVRNSRKLAPQRLGFWMRFPRSYRLLVDVCRFQSNWRGFLMPLVGRSLPQLAVLVSIFDQTRCLESCCSQ